MFQIGSFQIENPVVLAPMAGVTDRPFRQLCRQLGAGLAVSEMTTADASLWHTEKSRLRRDHDGESAPISVQIAGYDPRMLADAARFNVDHGAQIIDINMGCPARKVCRVDSGSALMRDEPLVAAICAAVARAVPVPVTLKIRSGWARTHRNGVQIAHIAQDNGIAALAVHGRTREDHYAGCAEYDTATMIKQRVRIPVLVNGDIDTPQKARAVLKATGCDGVMIGRAAQGRPWIFREIAHFLSQGVVRAAPTAQEVGSIWLGHLDALHDFYGEGRGVRVARKHIQWYCRSHEGAAALWMAVSGVDCARRQREMVAQFLAATTRLAVAA